MSKAHANARNMNQTNQNGSRK